MAEAVHRISDGPERDYSSKVLKCRQNLRAEGCRKSMEQWRRPASDIRASAAVSTLDRILHHLEKASGKSRSEVSHFALHEPNPRVVGILAQRAKVPLEKISFVSRTSGNLPGAPGRAGSACAQR